MMELIWKNVKKPVQKYNWKCSFIKLAVITVQPDGGV